MSWFEESVAYQIYPLGLCGAPYENDGVLVHRLRKIVDDGWVSHMGKLGVSCLILNPVFESLSQAMTPATTPRSIAASERTKT